MKERVCGEMRIRGNNSKGWCGGGEAERALRAACGLTSTACAWIVFKKSMYELCDKCSLTRPCEVARVRGARADMLSPVGRETLRTGVVGCDAVSGIQYESS